MRSTVADLHAGGAAGIGQPVTPHVFRFANEGQEDDLVAAPLGAERQDIGEPLLALAEPHRVIVEEVPSAAFPVSRNSSWRRNRLSTRPMSSLANWPAWRPAARCRRKSCWRRRPCGA